MTHRATWTSAAAAATALLLSLVPGPVGAEVATMQDRRHHPKHHSCTSPDPTAVTGFWKNCGELPTSLPVTFRVNPNSPPSSAPANWVEAITEAAATWVMPFGPSAIRVNSSTTAAHPGVKDGINTVGWGDPAACGAPGARAVACMYYAGTTGVARHRIVETDIILSRAHTWAYPNDQVEVLFGTVSGTVGIAMQPWFDMQETMTHEFGHVLGLEHVGDETAPSTSLVQAGANQQVMFFEQFRGSTSKRQLGVGDLLGLRYVTDAVTWTS